MEGKQKLDLRNWSWAATAYHIREALQNILEGIKNI